MEASKRVDTIQPKPKPPWLRMPNPSGRAFFQTKRDLRERHLHTICQSARCPNIGECWNQGNATILIMGDVCTRDCLFCSVPHGQPEPPDPREPDRILELAKILGLSYIVITSVTRDDLHDGGSRHFAAVIRTLKRRLPELLVEVLVPDFSGRPEDIDRVLAAGPDVLNHNLETVRRLYPAINRAATHYDISLAVLRRAARSGSPTKSGLMVGLGETPAELETAMSELVNNGVELLTIGQYLQPTRNHHPVHRYYRPDEFRLLKETALRKGFRAVESGPLVRSSYHAEQMYRHRGGGGVSG